MPADAKIGACSDCSSSGSGLSDDIWAMKRIHDEPHFGRLRLLHPGVWYTREGKIWLESIEQPRALRIKTSPVSQGFQIGVVT